MIIKLSQLKQGERAQILRFSEGNKAYQRRLMAMGFLPGTMVQLTRVAPLGDPIEVSLRGYVVSLRKNEANSIELEKVPV